MITIRNGDRYRHRLTNITAIVENDTTTPIHTVRLVSEDGLGMSVTISLASLDAFWVRS